MPNTRFLFAMVGLSTLLTLSAGNAQAQATERGTPTVTPGAAPDTAPRRAGYTGFNIQQSATMRPGQPVETSFPVINVVFPGTPAARAGLQVGDTILDVNGVDARKPGSLFPTPGEPYVVRVRRADAEREFALVPIEKPRKPAGARPPKP